MLRFHSSVDPVVCCVHHIVKCHRRLTAKKKKKSKRSKQPQPLFNNTVRAQWV